MNAAGGRLPACLQLGRDFSIDASRLARLPHEEIARLLYNYYMQVCVGYLSLASTNRAWRLAARVGKEISESPVPLRLMKQAKMTSLRACEAYQYDRTS